MGYYFFKEIREKVFYDKDTKTTVTRGICPECINHEQGDNQDYLDCKNLFLNNQRKVISQCCCWSRRHGLRTK